MNRLASCTDPDGGVTSYTYDNVGNRESVTYPNGATAEYTYDDLNRLVYLDNRKSNSEVISIYTYTLDAAGNRVSVAENTGRMVNYAYDDLYRLAQETITDPATGNQVIAYTYDAFGNRLTKTGPDGTVAYTYDANDRLVSESGPGSTKVYAYDLNGNTIQVSGDTVQTYAYDVENRLASVDDGSVFTAFAYDADGIRIGKTVDGAATAYLVDKNRDYAQVLEERNGSGSLTVSYVYGDDLISQDRGDRSFYLYDGQLSTRQLTGADGTVTDDYSYDSFGILLNKTGSTENDYLYAGEQYDPNAGFYYLRARYMNPETGRFLTTDPYQGRMQEPMTLHKYLYAGDNPVMNADPSGKYSASLAGLSATLAIANILTSMAQVSIVSGLIESERRDPDAYLLGIDGGALFLKVPPFFSVGVGGSVEFVYFKSLGWVPYISLGPSFGYSKSGGVTFEGGVVWNINKIDHYEKWYYSTSVGHSYGGFGVPAWLPKVSGAAGCINMFFSPSKNIELGKRSFGYTIGAGPGSSGLIFQNNYRFYWYAPWLQRFADYLNSYIPPLTANASSVKSFADSMDGVFKK